MIYLSLLALVVALTSFTNPARSFVPKLESRQERFSPNQQRADAVKEAFKHAWDGYYKFAFPNDELLSVTNGSSNSRNGWGASAVDAFSTALVMEIPEVVNQILDFVPTINFDQTNSEVSLFETTIRYLGGLLSGQFKILYLKYTRPLISSLAYDLLKGPLSNIASSGAKVDLILQQATHLADNLAYAFDTPTGIPRNNLFISNKTTNESPTNSLATIGTLVLEWTHLSDLTGNQTYAKLSQKAQSYLMNPKPASSEPWPGLVGSDISINTGEFQDAYGGWIGGSDSFYEYLIKMYAYDISRFETYRDRWILAADSSISHIASTPSSRPDLTFLAQYNGTKLILQSEHLACFDGGNFIYGGLVLNEQKYIDFGLELVEGCHETYEKTLTGLGPETFRWVTDTTPDNDLDNPQPLANQADFYAKAGFFFDNPVYALRPEVIESFYYAYRATGDNKYQEWAWNAFLSLNQTCRTASGFAPITDTNKPGGGSFLNFQESFFFAEVIKYSYLIHAPEKEWQVEYEGSNPWVYNTEAHPFRVAGSPV
ncbi:putative mannosyl-oligosaccharide alpha-1,2-mannosidase 1B [Golovinomyces cichoracearum]|uniref:alpha-1,2-Mannosidase n=1 Tax=Golovinomyces cichoracearum TaxID=62708 RepID=A0A420H7W1_9PEZI|nr:putative mannosyl-oligosaccharide alpha-1,2-mannosidase 1B [Golovinomyces cichoracearum]